MFLRKEISFGVITARAKDKGKIIFSGPPDTNWLKAEFINVKNMAWTDFLLTELFRAKPCITFG
jgi:hypothetical protein